MSEPATNRVVIQFADDHSLDGARIEVDDVSPEQLAVAAYLITRVANQLSTARDMALAIKADTQRAETIEVARGMADPRIIGSKLD